MWSERNQRGIEGEPPCDGCLIDLNPENVDAVNIFQVVRYQLIVGGMGTPMDINHLAVHEAIRTYEIKNPKTCFEKVCRLSRWWISKLNKKEKD